MSHYVMYGSFGETARKHAELWDRRVSAVRDLLLDLAAEDDRLRLAIAAALESAEEEGVDHHRGTDDPRRFVVILREALAAPPGAGAGGEG